MHLAELRAHFIHGVIGLSLKLGIILMGDSGVIAEQIG